MLRWKSVPLLGLCLCQAQEPASPPATVFSVSTTLVQIDSVVTDSKGHQVTNLKPDDFQALVDGKPQPIPNFSYVHLDSPDVNRPSLSPKRCASRFRPPIPWTCSNPKMSAAAWCWWSTISAFHWRACTAYAGPCGSSSPSRCSRAIWWPCGIPDTTTASSSNSRRISAFSIGVVGTLLPPRFEWTGARDDTRAAGTREPKWIDQAQPDRIPAQILDSGPDAPACRHRRR